MITAITLENFKGIGNAVTIPIRPLTIMFGKNSAGKSTVVQALHYAREILQRENLDADRTLFGGTAVDLGGFRNLVNNHDLDKQMRLKFEIELSPFGVPENYLGMRFADSIENAAIELILEWSETLNRPIITNCKTWINEVEGVSFQRTKDNANFYIEYNENHPLLNLLQEPLEPEDSLSPNWVQTKLLSILIHLPKENEFLKIDSNEQDENTNFDDESMTIMLAGPFDFLRDWLTEFRYIGPLRTIPSRNFKPTATKEEADWANGTAAWNELCQTRQRHSQWSMVNEYDEPVMKTSHWLSSEKLKTGYQLKLKQFREIPLDSPLMTSLINKTVFDDIVDTAAETRKYPIVKQLVLLDEKSGLEVLPNDIGIGISQVIPIVVAAVVSSDIIVAIEQPELHLHPAVQAELGDLFIESSLGDKHNFFLIETHSEHLILRILRRIRETTAGKRPINEEKVSTDDLALLFVGERGTGGEMTILNLRVDARGRIVDQVPGGFFEEDFAEVF